jgi:hypothetical protein
MRTFLTIVVPLLLPTALYLLYIFALRPRWSPLQPGGSLLTSRLPWMWLALIGAVLMLATFFSVATLEDAPPGSHYEPAKAVDGTIEPGRLE